MLDKIKNSPLARWILLVPGILISAILAIVVCNIILLIKGSSGSGHTWFGFEVTSSDPESKVRNGMGYYIVAYLMQPAFMGGLPVFNGRSIAPEHKNFVGWTVFSLFVILAIGSFITLFQANKGSLPISLWIGGIAFIVGAAIGAKAPLDK
jgi:hypothetical protein